MLYQKTSNKITNKKVKVNLCKPFFLLLKTCFFGCNSQMFIYHADLSICNLAGLFHGGFWIWIFNILVLPSHKVLCKSNYKTLPDSHLSVFIWTAVNTTGEKTSSLMKYMWQLMNSHSVKHKLILRYPVKCKSYFSSLKFPFPLQHSWFYSTKADTLHHLLRSHLSLNVFHSFVCSTFPLLLFLNIICGLSFNFSNGVR